MMDLGVPSIQRCLMGIAELVIIGGEVATVCNCVQAVWDIHEIAIPASF